MYTDSKIFMSSDQKQANKPGTESQMSMQQLSKSAGPTRGPVKATSAAIHNNQGQSADSTYK